MGSIKFNKQNGRLKRQLPGQDHYSGLIFYSANLPAGFGANDRMKEIADLAAAEALGITADNANLPIKIMHYHISELFRLNPDAVLYVGVFDVPAGAHTFAEISALRIFAQGKMRQVGVWTSKAFIAGDVALLQAQYSDAYTAFSPLEILYSPNMYNLADADLPSVSALLSPNVHVFIGQDGAALGKSLYDASVAGTLDASVGVIGAAVGATSLAKVSENIGWVDKFNMAVPGGELDVPALSNGTLIKNLSDAITKDGGTLDTKRLIFLKNYPGGTGSFFNDSHGAVVASDDYAYMEDNRAMDKAIRGVYLNLLPNINGPVQIDPATGQLAAEYLEFLKLEAGKALEQMEKDGELSGYEVSIDPNQDVNATSKVIVNITNTKVGVSRRFEVNIGY